MHSHLRQLWNRVRPPAVWVTVTCLLNSWNSVEFILLLLLPENMLLDLPSPCTAFQPFAGTELRSTQVKSSPCSPIRPNPQLQYPLQGRQVRSFLSLLSFSFLLSCCLWSLFLLFREPGKRDWGPGRNILPVSVMILSLYPWCSSRALYSVADPLWPLAVYSQLASPCTLLNPEIEPTLQPTISSWTIVSPCLQRNSLCHICALTCYFGFKSTGLLF